MDDLKNGIVCQSNKLIEARYSLTTNEQKLVVIMIALINKDDEDFKDYKIRILEFSNLLKLKNKNIHRQVRELLLRLLDRTIVIEKSKHSFLGMGWVSSAEYIAEKGIVELSFDKKLKPYLLELKKEFTKLDLFKIIQFRSNYTIRIYMLLKQYEKIGVREFDLLDFKKKLRVEKLYPRFNNLRQRIIQQAKKEFDEKDKQGHFLSDINFHFEPIKRGRSVTRIRFIIFQNQHKTVTDPENVPLIKSEIPALATSTTNDLSPALKQLLDFGVAGATAEAIIKKHPADYIQEKLQLTTEEDRKSPVGFLVKALENDYKSKKVAQQKIKIENKNKALAKEKQAKRNKLITELSEEYGHIKRKQFLDSLSEEETTELTHTLTQQCKDNNRAYGLRFIEMDLALEHNAHVFDYIDARIPNFEEGKWEYVKSKLMENC